MNGKKARILRKQAGFNPNAPRDASQYKEVEYPRTFINAKGKMETVMHITRSLQHSSARRKYQDLKNLYRMVGY